MKLYGKTWTRRELEARVGDIRQIGGVTRLKHADGKETGVEVIRVRTGSGLAYDVTPQKGLDISLAELGGVPLSWQAPNGNVHPMYYGPEGADWLRTASGGLLMTCGLAHVGSPGSDAHGRYGLHGRVHHTPASHIAAGEHWSGDELELRVSGIVEETAIFGGHLRLIREISSFLGENRIVIRDRVENRGFRSAPHLMLYHFNFGFPLLGEQTEVRFPAAELAPKEEGTPVEGYDRWQAPDAQAEERVYYHRLRPEAKDEAGMAEVSIHNRAFPANGAAGPVAVTLRWSADTLPLLVQWRMPGEGDHVLGLEPSNCVVGGREAVIRDRGGLPELAPGEAVEYRLELNVQLELPSS
ncbi:aldose 1-epimerase family protein [Paenibacillus hodogayensis]|uniref:Aldose 1-epimerase family protein n=1 Tax=Paenibacillus hodogayensis TaxID=279208 RepID=A0ABV5VQL6_9BACL